MTCQLQGVSCKALIDTGSDISLVRPGVLPNVAFKPANKVMETVTGELAPMQGSCTLSFVLGSANVMAEFWLANIREDCILGVDCLGAVGAVVDVGKSTVLVGGSPVILNNPNHASYTVNASTSVGGQALGDDPCWEGVSSETAAALEDLWNRSKEGLSPDELRELRGLLMEYRHLFAATDGECTRTNLVQHSIDTGNAAPIRQRPRRLPLVKSEAVEAEISRMEAAGVIEPSDSPWLSPVVPVTKKNGGLRLCHDYRRVNEVTRKDSYPVPRVDDTLDAIVGSQWFSSLDLRSGYWQVELSPDAKPKTAFSNGRGLWQYTVMPFGLCNAPASFERLMDKVLRPVPRSACVVYLDDVLVHGVNFSTAVSNLRKVFECFQSANLRMNPKKCSLLRRETHFLGHVVGPQGVSTDPEKVRAVREWPIPRCRKEVRGFVGLASYYRRFIRSFAEVARPLHKLMEKGREFQWDSDCQRAFETLQQALTNAPTLMSPTLDHPFVLDTDASDSAVGAVLSQQTEGEPVIAYYSKSLSVPERNYCVTRRELLAVVLAIRHFHPYLYGRRFLLRTDHAALCWLLSFKEPEGQVARWIEILQGYDFQIEHRAGPMHGNADALSRRPCAKEGCRHCSRLEERAQNKALVAQVREPQPPSPLLELSFDELREHQRADPVLGPLLRWKQEGAKPGREESGPCSPAIKTLLEKWESLSLQEGVLYRSWQAPGGQATWQLVVPKSLQDNVLKLVHGAPGAGHFGYYKTLRKLQKKFYWGQHHKDVEAFCRKCDECVAKKGPAGQSHAPLQQYQVGSPMERVGVDVMGPFPMSNRGNRYVLVAMDYFSKWPEAYAVPDQETSTILDCLLGGMFSRFGIPLELHSDQGRNFESRLFAALCDRLGIKKTRTTPLHPQSDGLVERFNRTLATQLAILTSEDQRDWDEQLPLILFSYRSAVQESTRCTPAQLMMGRELRTPADLVYGRPPGERAPLAPGLDYLHRLQNHMDTVHAVARENLAQAGFRQKKAYDAYGKGREFQEGERVWVFNPRRKKGRCPKLDSAWEGPCLILQKISEVVYKVKLRTRQRVVVLHRDRLAPYLGSADTTDNDECEVTAGETHSDVPQNGTGNVQEEHYWGTETENELAPFTGDPVDTQVEPAPLEQRPRGRRRQRPQHLGDYVCEF